MKESINIKKGLSIYKEDRSPFWYARVWNPITRKYKTTSTKIKNRIEATKAAIEWADDYNPVEVEEARLKAIEKQDFAFEKFAQQLPNDKPQAKKDWQYLTRDVDGILEYFGKMSIKEIRTSDIRNYINFVNDKRDEPLAVTTQKKHLGTIKKVFTVALESDVITTIPTMPKLDKVEDKPRASFTPDEYKKFFDTMTKCFGKQVEGETISKHHAIMFGFLKYSFLRPVESELFALKFKDVVVKKNPDHLQIKVKGKTGYRTISTMPMAVKMFEWVRDNSGLNSPDDFVFMPHVENRQTAIRKSGKIFGYVADIADLKEDEFGNKRSVYSFRHHCIQSRIIESRGTVNLLTLAKMCGTSLEVIDRFYARNMPLTDEMIKNLQGSGMQNMRIT